MKTAKDWLQLVSMATGPRLVLDWSRLAKTSIIINNQQVLSKRYLF